MRIASAGNVPARDAISREVRDNETAMNSATAPKALAMNPAVMTSPSKMGMNDPAWLFASWVETQQTIVRFTTSSPPSSSAMESPNTRRCRAAFARHRTMADRSRAARSLQILLKRAVKGKVFRSRHKLVTNSQPMMITK